MPSKVKCLKLWKNALVDENEISTHLKVKDTLTRA
jgi:hypothetical protein